MGPLVVYGMFLIVSWQACVSVSAIHSLLAHPAMPRSLLPCDTGLSLETFLLKERNTAQVHSIIGVLNFPLGCLHPIKRDGQGKSKWSLCSFFLFSLKGFSRRGNKGRECRGCVGGEGHGSLSSNAHSHLFVFLSPVLGCLTRVSSLV